jgi:hypothetical protein
MKANTPVPIRADEVMNPRGEPKATPCSTCVWRLANRDYKTGQGEDYDTHFTRDTLSKAWQGKWDTENPSSAFKCGAVNTCHQTHQHPCAGALALQQRELLRRHSRSALAARGSHALTDEGISRIATRMLNGGARDDSVEPIHPWFVQFVPLERLLAAAHPALRDPAIGHEDLAPPERGEFEADGDAAPPLSILLAANSRREEGRARRVMRAYEDGQLVGYVWINPRLRTPVYENGNMMWQRQPSAEVGFHTMAGAAGRGIGRQLGYLVTRLAFEYYGHDFVWTRANDGTHWQAAYVRILSSLGYGRLEATPGGVLMGRRRGRSVPWPA